MSGRRRDRSGQQGQAMVETALMIMVVLLLLMGVIQFGFIFYAYVRVSNATREGARVGSLWRMGTSPLTLCEQVEAGVKSEVNCVTDPDPGKNCDITVILDGAPVADCAAADPALGEPITVTVTYDYELPVITALPIIRDVIQSPFPVSRTLMMRIQ